MDTFPAGPNKQVLSEGWALQEVIAGHPNSGAEWIHHRLGWMYKTRTVKIMVHFNYQQPQVGTVGGFLKHQQYIVWIYLILHIAHIINVYIFHISRNVYTTHIPIPLHHTTWTPSLPPTPRFHVLGSIVVSTKLCMLRCISVDLWSGDFRPLAVVTDYDNTRLDDLRVTWLEAEKKIGWKLFLKNGVTFGIVSRDRGQFAICSCPLFGGFAIHHLEKGFQRDGFIIMEQIANPSKSH